MMGFFAFYAKHRNFPFTKLFAGYLKDKKLREGYSSIHIASSHRDTNTIFGVRGSARTIVAQDGRLPMFTQLRKTSSQHKEPHRIYSYHGSLPALKSSETAGRYYLTGLKREVFKCNLPSLYAIQGFPKNFRIHPVKSHARKQVGNSVAVPLFQQVIAEVIKQGLLGKRNVQRSM